MKQHLLIIDDERARTDALSVEARGRSLEVTVCDKPKNFLQLADTLLPSVVILSSDLEHPSGWAVLNRLKTHKVLSELPLVLLVGGDDPEQVAEQHARLRTRAQAYLPARTAPGAVLDAAVKLLPPDRQAFLEELYRLRERTPSPAGHAWLLGLIIVVAVAVAIFWYLR